MPKKSKVNKLARMSDEERARYLQHRADMEEEARRRKRELIAKFIKNKLDKEESYSKMNTAKINQEWRYILRKIKCKQMALDIQGMIASFNFLVERKDRQIAALVRATEAADDQHKRAFQAHTETLSYFLSIGNQRLDKLQSEYEHQKNTLLENWDTEESVITENQDRAELKLILISYIQDRDVKNYIKLKEMERATAKNDERLEHEEEMRALCRPKQLELESYCNRLREVYNSFLEHHNPIMAHYRALREKDDFYQRDIARNEHLIERATEMFLNLQNEWIRTNTTISSKLNRMISHKDELSRRYWQMKKESKSASERADEMLAVLVDASQEAIKRLTDVKDKLQKITQMGDICSKCESEKLDVMIEYGNNDESDLNFENLNPAMVDECKEFQKMEKFLLKENRAKVHTMCLKAEKAKLIKENVQLKQYIKKYLTELALDGERDRPFSTRLQTNMIDHDRKTLNRPVTCIEGVLSNAVMHEKRMKLLEKKNKEIGGICAYPRVHCWKIS